MWPHSIGVAAGDACVGLGTDDPEIVATLAPFVASLLPRGDLPWAPDFGLELHPDPPAWRAAPRALPSLHHGTKVLGRSQDAAVLRDGLLRSLASIAEPMVAGRVRVSGLPLSTADGIVLAPPDAADRQSHRSLLRRGLVPVFVGSVVIDPLSLQVHIPAPLGGVGDPIIAPLLHWWLPLPGADHNEPLSLGRVVALAAHRLATPWFDDELDGAAADAAGCASLAALAMLVDRCPPALEDFGG